MPIDLHYEVEDLNTLFIFLKDDVGREEFVFPNQIHRIGEFASFNFAVPIKYDSLKFDSGETEHIFNVYTDNKRFLTSYLIQRAPIKFPLSNSLIPVEAPIIYKDTGKAEEVLGRTSPVVSLDANYILFNNLYETAREIWEQINDFDLYVFMRFKFEPQSPNNYVVLTYSPDVRPIIVDTFPEFVTRFFTGEFALLPKNPASVSLSLQLYRLIPKTKVFYEFHVGFGKITNYEGGRPILTRQPSEYLSSLFELIMNTLKPVKY